MPTKRRVLETLNLKELQDIASTYDLEVDDRRVRDQLIEAAGHSRKVPLAEVLGSYARDRLKELCRALDLDDHGKEKAPIVDRILGNAPEQGNLKLPWPSTASSPPEKAPEAPKPVKQPAAKPAPKRPSSSESGGDLGFEAKLWLAADKLRNNMDAAEYKHVVLGLIFLKYISDAFEELHAKLVAGEGEYDGADPEDPDE